MIPPGLGGNVGCDPVVMRRGRSSRGVAARLFEAASPGQLKELGNQRGWSRLRSCSLITVSPTQPLCCLFLQPWPITARPHGNSNMETYQGLSSPHSLCGTFQEKRLICCIVLHFQRLLEHVLLLHFSRKKSYVAG